MKAQVFKSISVFAMALMIFSSIQAQTFVAMRVNLVGSQNGYYPLESEITSITATYDSQFFGNPFQNLVAGPSLPNTDGFTYIESTGNLTFNLANFGASLSFNPTLFTTTFQFDVDINSQTYSTGAFQIPATTVSGQPAPIEMGTLSLGGCLDCCSCNDYLNFQVVPPTSIGIGTVSTISSNYGCFSRKTFQNNGITFGETNFGNSYNYTPINISTIELKQFSGAKNGVPIAGIFEIDNYWTPNPFVYFKNLNQISCVPPLPIPPNELDLLFYLDSNSLSSINNPIINVFGDSIGVPSIDTINGIVKSNVYFLTYDCSYTENCEKVKIYIQDGNSPRILNALTSSKEANSVEVYHGYYNTPKVTTYFFNGDETIGKANFGNEDYLDNITISNVGEQINGNNVGGVVNFSYCNGLNPFPFTLYLDNSTLTGISQIAVANDGSFINSTVTAEADYTKIEFTANDCSNFYIQDGNDPPIQDNPLAVSISEFSGEFVKGEIILNWKTESEIENQGFILQRKDQSDSLWTEIANFKTHKELVGIGNSSTEQLYSFTDKNFELNKNYSYRIFDVDFDSKETLFEEVVNVSTESQISKDLNFRLEQNFPNPFNPTTSINYELEITNYENVKLVIFDVLGNKVKEFNLTSSQGTVVWDGKNVDGKSVASGVYFYKIEGIDFASAKKMLLLK